MFVLSSSMKLGQALYGVANISWLTSKKQLCSTAHELCAALLTNLLVVVQCLSMYIHVHVHRQSKQCYNSGTSQDNCAWDGKQTNGKSGHNNVIRSCKSCHMASCPRKVPKHQECTNKIKYCNTVYNISKLYFTDVLNVTHHLSLKEYIINSHPGFDTSVKKNLPNIIVVLPIYTDCVFALYILSTFPNSVKTNPRILLFRTHDLWILKPVSYQN